MTTINDISDLVRILDEKPEWLEAVRARVLSRELLNLPEEFARFVAEVRQSIVAANRRLDALEAGQQQMQAAIGTMQAAIGTMQAAIGIMQADIGTMQTDIGTMQTDIGTMQTDIGTTQADIGTMQTDIGTMQTDIGTMQTDIGTAQTDIGTMQTDIGTMQTDIGTMQTDIGTMQTDIGTMQTDIGTMQTDIGSLKSDVNTMKNHLADVRGRIVYDVTRDEAPFLAADMGFTYVATFSRGDLRKLLERVDTGDITPQDLQSFRRADLIIEAAKPDGTAVYITVEISYTVDEYDIRRARRNAQYLTRLTGVPAVPAVAGVIVDPRVQDTIAAGDPYWHEILISDLQPE